MDSAVPETRPPTPDARTLAWPDGTRVTIAHLVAVPLAQGYSFVGLPQANRIGQNWLLRCAGRHRRGDTFRSERLGMEIDDRHIPREA